MSGVTKGAYDHNFSVGSRGISGHYDTMLGKFRDGTAAAIFTLACWSWVLSWPSHSVIVQIGPVLTGARLVVIALLIWTVRAWWPIAVGFFYRFMWRRLERQGLHTTVVNDHTFRVTLYRMSDNSLIYDGTTQASRLTQEVSSNQRRRTKIFEELKVLGVGLLILLALPIVAWLFPILIGPKADAAVVHVTNYININELISQSQTDAPDFANWLRRRDVYGILAPLRASSMLVWFLWWGGIIPALSDLCWTLYDGYVHHSGNQFIPAAKVAERWVPAKTLDTVRQERVHGDAAFVDPGEAARSMSE